MGRNRQQHKKEVQHFLEERFKRSGWTFTLPSGTGNETYLARSGKQRYFVKVGGYPGRAVALAEAGISPPVLAAGHLPGGQTVLIQSYTEGTAPRPRDLQVHLEQVAGLLGTMHRNPSLRKRLRHPGMDLYKAGALRALQYVKQQWALYSEQLPSHAAVMDRSLPDLERQIDQMRGEGLVSSHGDFCNANMLLTPEGKLYIIDLELMSLDDPALDLGAALWWYYPPSMRRRFIEAAGYQDTPDLRHRMQVRMALHCLCAALPRPTGFDTLDLAPDGRWADFRAVYEGAENPQGY